MDGLTNGAAAAAQGTSVAAPAANGGGAVAVSQPRPPAVKLGERGAQPQTIDDLWRIAARMHASGLAPKSFGTEAQVFVAMAHALEIGLSPFSGLQNLAVINGKVSMYGDAPLALVRRSGLLEEFEEWLEDMDGERLERPADISKALKDGDLRAVCRVKRKGQQPIIRDFSLEDADAAKLRGKDGPWKTYTKRMLMFRARGYALRDGFGDVLNGTTIGETTDPGEMEYEVEAREVSTASTAAPLGLAQRIESRAAKVETKREAQPEAAKAPAAKPALAGAELTPEEQAELFDDFGDDETNDPTASR